MEHVLDLRAGGLRHAAARVGGERLEVAARALCVDDAERERGLAAPRDARDADDPPEGDVDVEVPEVVLPRAAHLDRDGRPAFGVHAEEVYHARLVRRKGSWRGADPATRRQSAEAAA